MENIVYKIKNTRILAAIGIAGLVLGTILPYIHFNFFGVSYSLSLWKYWEGKVVMVLAVANLLFIFKDIVEKYVPSLLNSGLGSKIAEIDNPKYSIIPTALSAILTIYLTTQLEFSSFKLYSIGFYCLWIGTIALVAFAFLYNKNGNQSTNEINHTSQYNQPNQNQTINTQSNDINNFTNNQ